MLVLARTRMLVLMGAARGLAGRRLMDAAGCSDGRGDAATGDERGRCRGRVSTAEELGFDARGDVRCHFGTEHLPVPGEKRS